MPCTHQQDEPRWALRGLAEYLAEGRVAYPQQVFQTEVAACDRASHIRGDVYRTHGGL